MYIIHQVLQLLQQHHIYLDSIDIHAPSIAALLADSGATTPAKAISPNGTFGFLTVIFASLYVISAAISPPDL